MELPSRSGVQRNEAREKMIESQAEYQTSLRLIAYPVRASEIVPEQRVPIQLAQNAEIWRAKHGR